MNSFKEQGSIAFENEDYKTFDQCMLRIKCFGSDYHKIYDDEASKYCAIILEKVENGSQLMNKCKDLI